MTTTPAPPIAAYLTPPIAAAFCDGLVAYSVVTVTTSTSATVRLMARDLPRPGRRYTHLDAGIEVFALAEYLLFVAATDLTVTPENHPDTPTVEVVLKEEVR